MPRAPWSSFSASLKLKGIKGCHVSSIAAKIVNTEEGGVDDDVVYGHVHKNLFDHWEKESCKLFVII